jgi:hypothetical protein
MCALTDMDADVEHIAANQAAGRMHQHVVADARPLGVQAPEHAQWTIVREVHRGFVGLLAIVERQLHAKPWVRSPPASECLFAASLPGPAAITSPRSITT